MRNYKLTLWAEGPIHIGDGRKIGKKEYIYVRNRNQVYVPDMAKMYEFFSEEGLLGEYENYLLGDRRDFIAWLREKKLANPKQFEKWTAYILDGADAVFEEKSKKEILTFIKDPYGCPYVPGSSVKGMLRTILLSEMIWQSEEKQGSKGALDGERTAIRRARLSDSRTKLLRQETAQLEQKFFHTLNRPGTKFPDKVNDALSGLRVSDSRPLSTKDLILCQKIDLTVDGREKPLPIFRECLCPGTQITFDLSLADSFPFSADQLLQAAEHFQQNYDQYFAEAFPLKGIQGGNGTAYLGGGAGYASKTAAYPLLGIDGIETISQIIDATLPFKQRQQHKHHLDVQKNVNVSPHMLKCARYEGKLYEMGACSLAIEPKE